MLVKFTKHYVEEANEMEKYQKIVAWAMVIVVFIITLIVFVPNDDIPLIFRIIGPPVSTLVIVFLIDHETRDRQKNTARSTKRSVKTVNPKQIYIYKPFDNGFTYRIEWQHGRQYVFEGHSNRYIYRIEGNKIYRGSETKVYYQLKGNKVYRAFDYKDPVYRIDGDKVYQGNFGTRPVFTIGSRAVR